MIITKHCLNIDVCKANSSITVLLSYPSSCKCQDAFVVGSLRYQAGISRIWLWMERSTTHTHTHTHTHTQTHTHTHTHTHIRSETDTHTHLYLYVIARHSTIQIHKLLGNRVGFSCIQLAASEDFTSRHSAEVSDCGDRTVPQQNRSTMVSSVPYFQPCYSR